MDMKNYRRIGVTLTLALLVFLLGISGVNRDHSALAGVPSLAPAPGQADAKVGGPAQQVSAIYRGVSTAVKFDVSPPLTSLSSMPLPYGKIRENEDRDNPGGKPSGLPTSPDTAIQRLLGPFTMPTPLLSFNGPPNGCGGCAPPDPNGEVGPNHYVVMTNLTFQVFNKTGTSVYGPVANNTLWSGFGGACQTENAGDPVVLYDQLADRWLLSQFTAAGPTYYNCVALSTSPDPTGSYYRWAFTTGSNFPDYPKYGMWPDAYYISTREFAGGGPFAGVGAYATNRVQMLAGNPSPQVISFLASPSPAYNVGDGLLPADMDGTTPPPVNSPNYFVGSMDNNAGYGAPQDALTLWKFHADFVTPANSSFTLANTLPTAPFNSIFAACGGTRNCIPQPGTTNKIDILSSRQRPLFRLAYRNMGGFESLLTNLSVSAGTGPSGEVAGIRWYELRSPNSSPVIFQQGTYAPGLTDGINRWMGSMAMDRSGDIALGYSASSSTLFPSVRYTGRLPGDTSGTLPQGEASIIDGTGSQTGGSNRWGDYSDMTVDPTDDCTFWYVSEYVPTTSSSGWQARIGSFKFPSCGAATPTPTRTVTVTPTLTQTPTNTPTPHSLVGHVSWQGRTVGSAAYQAPISLTLKAGATEVNYPVQNTDTSGFFTVSLGALNIGNYQFRAKGPNGTANLPANSPPGYLAVTGTFTLSNVPITQVEMGLMKAGDANNDNIITALDFNILKSAYGKGVGQLGYDSRADFDGSQVVTVQDFNLLKNNYGLPGGGPIAPEVKPLK